MVISLSVISGFFPCGSYDGILGIDWLAAHSPIQVDWSAHWLAFQHKGALITLLGENAAQPICTLFSLYALTSATDTALSEIPPEVQLLLDKYASVFEAPSGLPPRR